MIGGLNLKTVRDSEFKYTRDEDRIRWTKNAVPIGQYLIPCIRNIPWLKYSFTGKTTLWAENPDHAESFNPHKNDKLESESSCISEEIKIKAELSSEPYYFFGGCVYEILNAIVMGERVHSNDINLRDYVDPTGDIDVRITAPYFIIDQPYDYDFSSYLLTENGTRMTTFLDHYTDWVFNQLKEQVQSMPLFEKLFENTEAFELSEEPIEAAFANLSVRIGNLWLVRILEYQSKMVKIQLVVKFIDTKPNHILEIVLPIDTECTRPPLKNEIDSYMSIINGIRIESFAKLIAGNISSMLERKQYHNINESRHKFYNHIGRIQYLNKYLSIFPEHIQNIKKDIAKFGNLETELILLFDYLAKNREDGDLKLFSYNGKVSGEPYTDGKMMRSLVDNLVTFLNLEKDQIQIWKFKNRFSKKSVIDKLLLSTEGGYKRSKSRKNKTKNFSSRRNRR